MDVNLMTVREAARLANISESKIYYALSYGKIRGQSATNERVTLVDFDSLNEYLEFRRDRSRKKVSLAVSLTLGRGDFDKLRQTAARQKLKPQEYAAEVIKQHLNLL